MSCCKTLYFLLLLTVFGLVTAAEIDNSKTNASETAANETQVTCGVDETLVECPNSCYSDDCAKHYSDTIRPSICPKPEKCEPKCMCRIDFRRYNGTCIRTSECPPFKCPRVNEEYVACPLPVCSDSCDRATRDGKCHIFGRIGIRLICEPSCRCIKNYWRFNGTCVPYEQCPNIKATSTEPNTEPTEPTTSTIPSETVVEPSQTTESSEITTTTTNKPQLECGPNERQDDCPVDCQSDYCPQNQEEANMTTCIRPTDKDECAAPKCKCGFNSRYDANGTCISVYDCPPFECPGLNEEYAVCPSPFCSDSCDRATADGECHIIGRIGIVLRCEPTCRCKKYYWRLNGTCVPYDQCPNIKPTESTTTTIPSVTVEPSQTTESSDITTTTSNKPQLECGPNERQDDCPVDCQSDYCPKNQEEANMTTCIKPTDKDECVPSKCKCGFNSRYDANGTCISVYDCPPFECTGLNEEYAVCPSPFCSDSCERATADGECHIIGRIGIVLRCEPTCRCKKYYWRLNGTCVPYDQCPNIKPTESTTTTIPSVTVEPSQTTESSEITTTTSNKPQLECGPNERQDDCPVECQSDYCPQNQEEANMTTCIKPTDKDECAAPKCKCGFNSRYDANGTCISVYDCPPFECPGLNEEYAVCPSPFCSDSCERATADGECLNIGRIGIVVRCEPTCRCKKYYWRLNGTCVPYDQCPNIKPKEPTTSTIPSVTVEPSQTTEPSEITTTTTTIPQLECGPNETQDDCPVDCQSNYCPKNQEEALMTTCIRPSDKDECPPPRCKCGFNSRYDANGTCISVYDCPPFKCDGEYEEFNPCLSYCPGESCATATPDGRCPPLFGLLPVVNCEPACRCIKGYYRKNGICVPYAQCRKGETTTLPPTTTKTPDSKSNEYGKTTSTADASNQESTSSCCGPQEEWKCLLQSCQKDTCVSIVSRYMCKENEKCTYGCYCIDGYYRKTEGSPCVEMCECDEMKNSSDCNQ